MSYLSTLLRGERIADVYADEELTYIMLASGTQVTVRGLIVVEPASSSSNAPLVNGTGE